MRKLIVDACSWINIVRGGVLGNILSLEDHQFLVSPLVLHDELGEEGILNLQSSLDNSLINLIDDRHIPATAFSEILNGQKLGLGEIECIVAAQLFGFDVCSDDKSARRFAISTLGDKRVTGTLGLLKDAVLQEKISCQEAITANKKIITNGGFIPQVQDNFFCKFGGHNT